MLNFQNDYSYGAHPKVLEALTAINDRAFPGYGEDDACQAASEQIRELCQCPRATVHFLTGGTQANLTAISGFLRPWESVIAPASGHINGHEAGAVEATGHKILTVPATEDGKLTPEAMLPILEECEFPHLTLPRLVYISNATECGTRYTKAELEQLSTFCRAHDLLLFLDGARLGAALASSGNDVNWTDLPSLTDAFYIGGTKNGALLGEALVIVNPSLQAHFFRAMKQHGSVLAKGWILGVQFAALLKDGLYLDIAAHADAMAARLQEGIQNLGYPLMVHSDTNQIFAAIPNSILPRLSEQCTFEHWKPAGENATFVRFVTSFATTPAEVEELLRVLKTLREP